MCHHAYQRPPHPAREIPSTDQETNQHFKAFPSPHSMLQIQEESSRTTRHVPAQRYRGASLWQARADVTLCKYTSTFSQVLHHRTVFSTADASLFHQCTTPVFSTGSPTGDYHLYQCMSDRKRNPEEDPDANGCTGCGIPYCTRLF